MAVVADEEPAQPTIVGEQAPQEATAATRMDGGCGRREKNTSLLGWEVDEIHVQVQELKARGVKFKRYEFFEQDALDVWTTPDGAQVAWFEDPDGNTLSLTCFAKV